MIAGHPDAAGCNIKQEDFETQVRNRNIIFRIPTPVFGAGLIEKITDTTILNNLNSNSPTKSELRDHRSRQPQRQRRHITRFGWKAQNPSLLVFSGEAYNVEMGITNEAFPIERDETAELSVRHDAQRRDHPRALPADRRTSPTSSASWRRPRRRPTAGASYSITAG